MNIETTREYCLSLPMTSEDMPFGPDVLIFRVCNKIFAAYSFARENYFVLKADADYSIDLRDRYPDIEPAWHWNKKYWIQMSLSGTLSDDLIKSLIRNSYAEVVKKLPGRLKKEHPEICEIHE